MPSARTVARDTYRDWSIGLNWMDQYEAAHPDFDPTPVYADDGPSDHRWVSAGTRAELIEEIDAWIDEHEDRQPSTSHDDAPLIDAIPIAEK